MADEQKVGMTILGKIVIILVIIGLIGGAAYFFRGVIFPGGQQGTGKKVDLNAFKNQVGKVEAPDTKGITTVNEYTYLPSEKLPPVKVTWSDGGRKPEKPKDMAAMGDMPAGGQLLVGENGSIFDGSDYCESPRIVPEEKMKAFTPPPETLPRVPGGAGGHCHEWIKACKGQGPLPGSNFDHAGPLTEMVVMGNLAVRLGKKVEWDGPNMRCTNLPAAEPLLRKTYRIF